MAKLIFGLQQSLDGYVDHSVLGPPSPKLFRYFVQHVANLAGTVYGRRTYEIMRYWNDDQPDRGAEKRDFAAAWRLQPKWVVSRSLTSVGPNAHLVQHDFEAALRELKARLLGEVDIAGPDQAGSLTNLGLIDEYRLYFCPIVLGRGTPFFAGPRPSLRLIASKSIGEDTMKLIYAPIFITQLWVIWIFHSMCWQPPGRGRQAAQYIENGLNCRATEAAIRCGLFERARR